MSPDWILIAWLCGAIAADGGTTDCKARTLGKFQSDYACQQAIKHGYFARGTQIATCVPKDKAPAGEAAR